MNTAQVAGGGPNRLPTTWRRTSAAHAAPQRAEHSGTGPGRPKGFPGPREGVFPARFPLGRSASRVRRPLVPWSGPRTRSHGRIPAVPGDDTRWAGGAALHIGPRRGPLRSKRVCRTGSVRPYIRLHAVFHPRPHGRFRLDAPLPWPGFADLVPIARTPLPARTSLLPGRRRSLNASTATPPRGPAQEAARPLRSALGPSVTPLPRAGLPRRVGASAASSLGGGPVGRRLGGVSGESHSPTNPRRNQKP